MGWCVGCFDGVGGASEGGETNPLDGESDGYDEG